MLLTTSKAKNGKKNKTKGSQPLIRKESRKHYDEYARLNFKILKVLLFIKILILSDFAFDKINNL